MEDPLIAYKQAIKAHYQIEKHGERLNLLLSPTSARLRDLCLKILEKDLNVVDKKIIENFFGLEFGPNIIKKIKEEENRFRRFCNFLKEESDLSDDIYAADFLALLVNYTHRPYPKFKKCLENQSLLEDEKRLITGPQESLQGNVKIDSIAIKKNDDILFVTPDQQERANVSSKEIAAPLNTTTKLRSKHKTLIFFLIAISLVTGGYMAKDICFPKKQCMQWQEDHYEVVDCEVNGLLSISPIVALDEDLLEFRKVELRKGMEFFKYKKPLYFYYKVSRDSIEFFNAPGEHPITKKPLNEISGYIIDKYVNKTTPN